MYENENNKMLENLSANGIVIVTAANFVCIFTNPSGFKNLRSKSTLINLICGFFFCQKGLKFVPKLEVEISKEQDRQQQIQVKVRERDISSFEKNYRQTTGTISSHEKFSWHFTIT